MSTKTYTTLELENASLRERLAEAEAVLQAIRRREIDEVSIDPPREHVFTLERTDHAYRGLVESMNQGAATLTGDGLILYANHPLASLLGVPASRLRGTRFADWVVTQDVDRANELMADSVAERTSGELTLAGAKETLPIHASFSSLALRDGRFCCTIITDLRPAKHHAALELAARQLQEANDLLQLADQRKDKFLATLAYELRNPSAPIRAAMEALKVIDHKDQRIVRARDMIERQVAHMVRLINDLLELSRIMVGSIELQRRTESLTDVLTKVADAMQSAIGHGQTLIVDLTDDTLFVDIDSTRLARAVTNVLENATKYTPAGGRIVLRTTRESDQAVIRVSDTGIGIEPEMTERIFEMFVQVHRDEQRPPSGIGLALTRRLIEMHGGTIEVSSAGIGLGAEVTIRLPLVSRRVREVEAPAPHRDVLIVDDNVDAADSLRTLFELSGHTARAVYRGVEALETLHEFRPDLVLLDIGLPDLDGYELARRIRQRFGAACPTLVAVSGWGQEEDKQRAMEAGIDAYFTKPLNPASLAKILVDANPAPYRPLDAMP